jgi:WhiB family transcriptional regulator, redox-sensing transcriptional regulator
VAAIDFDTFTGDVHELVRLLEPAWQKDAACREHPEVTWHPARGEPTGPAKTICRGCAFRVPCLRYALAHDDVTGVWGGTSPGERHDARRRGLDAETMIAELDGRR